MRYEYPGHRFARLLAVVFVVFVVVACDILNAGDDADDDASGEVLVTFSSVSFNGSTRTLTFNGVVIENNRNTVVSNPYVWFVLSQDDQIGNADDVVLGNSVVSRTLFSGDQYEVFSSDSAVYVPQDVGGTYRGAVVVTETENADNLGASSLARSLGTENIAPSRVALSVQLLEEDRFFGADMTVYNDHLYIAVGDISGTDSFLYAADIADSQNITVTHRQAMDPAVDRVEAVGSSLYVGASGAGFNDAAVDVLVYDLSNPATPSTPTSFTLVSALDGDQSGVNDIIVDPARNRVYAVATVGLFAFDSTTDTLIGSSEIDIAGTFYRTGELHQPSTLILSNISTSTTGNQYAAVDLTDGTIDGSDITQQSSLSYIGDESSISGSSYALLDGDPFTRSVRIIDVSTAGTPSVIGDFSLPTGQTGFDIELSGNALYVAHGDGLTVYDVSDPSNVTVASTFVPFNDTSAIGRAIYLDTRVAYLVFDDPASFDTYLVALDRTLYEAAIP
ncbi:MAG: hypothetical protein MI724_19145 [Spirochaetales bacterium]|nr:hypothetical protein [Spirochaetales bacterium]